MSLIRRSYRGHEREGMVSLYISAALCGNGNKKRGIKARTDTFSTFLVPLIYRPCAVVLLYIYFLQQAKCKAPTRLETNLRSWWQGSLTNITTWYNSFYLNSHLITRRSTKSVNCRDHGICHQLHWSYLPISLYIRNLLRSCQHFPARAQSWYCEQTFGIMNHGFESTSLAGYLSNSPPPIQVVFHPRAIGITASELDIKDYYSLDGMNVQNMYVADIIAQVRFCSPQLKNSMMPVKKSSCCNLCL